jgi:signal transduction histidine kinase
VGLSVRLYVALLITLAPLVAILWIVEPAITTAAPGLDRRLALFALAALVLVWPAIVSAIMARRLDEQSRALVQLAEGGRSSAKTAQKADARAGETDDRARRVAESLAERNRQVAELATQANRAPLGEDPRLAAGHTVELVRSVTGDATWQLAILASGRPDALPAGVYGSDEPVILPSQLTDLHRWAASAGPIHDAEGRAHRREGPWGAFMVVDVAAREELRAILFAPWEGRAEPNAAELDLLNLIGQHAATVIEHAELYATVHAQAHELGRMATVQRDFLRGVSHDLQTPLTSIKALAVELRSQLPDLGSASDLDLIQHQADRLRRMVQQLLAMSRLEAGVLEPRLEVLNPRNLIERTWEALRAEGRPFTTVVEGRPVLVVADPDRLEQVLWAVLDNAVKYSPAGSPVLARVHSEDGSHVSIEIHDAGTGMDQQTATRAFEQFYRSELARRAAPNGSGIGLYTARGLVEAMGGRISVESVLGSGTSVRIDLPAEPIDDPAAEETHTESTSGVMPSAQG